MRELLSSLCGTTSLIIKIFATEGYVFWKEYVKFGKRLDFMSLPSVYLVYLPLVSLFTLQGRPPEDVGVAPSSGAFAVRIIPHGRQHRDSRTRTPLSAADL